MNENYCSEKFILFNLVIEWFVVWLRIFNRDFFWVSVLCYLMFSLVVCCFLVEGMWGWCNIVVVWGVMYFLFLLFVDRSMYVCFIVISVLIV